MIVVLATTVLLGGLPAPGYADPQVVTPATSVEQVLTNIRNLIMTVAASIATVFLSIAGLRYGMAGGDPGEVDAAKKAFRSACIGYGVMVLAPLVVEVLKGIVGS